MKATADDGLRALEPIGRLEWNKYNVYNGNNNGIIVGY